MESTILVPARIETLLRSKAVPHSVHVHAQKSRPIRNPGDFAAELGYALARITKTLFVGSPARDKWALIVCPMGKKVNLPLVAEALGLPRLEVASVDELKSLLGYPPNGVSPLGAGDIPVFIDCSLLDFPTICIGAGLAGVEIELSPLDLQTLTNATVLPLAV